MDPPPHEVFGYYDQEMFDRVFANPVVRRALTLYKFDTSRDGYNMLLDALAVIPPIEWKTQNILCKDLDYLARRCTVFIGDFGTPAPGFYLAEIRKRMYANKK